MAEILKLKQPSLTENPGGGYKGKGITEDGLEYHPKFTQDEQETILCDTAERENAPPIPGSVRHE